MPKHTKHHKSRADSVPHSMRLAKGQTVLVEHGRYAAITTTTPEQVVYEIREGTYLIWERIVSSKQFKVGAALQEAEESRESKLKELTNGV